MLLCHICLQSICFRSSLAAQRQRPGGRGYLSELPTLVTVQWLRLGSAEEARAADGVVECRGYWLTVKSREGWGGEIVQDSWSTTGVGSSAEMRRAHKGLRHTGTHIHSFPSPDTVSSQSFSHPSVLFFHIYKALHGLGPSHIAITSIHIRLQEHCDNQLLVYWMFLAEAKRKSGMQILTIMGQGYGTHCL